VKRFLGIDGGGSKTAFLLIDDCGQRLASHREGPAYYLETGFDAMREMLGRGIARTLEDAGLSADQIDFAFIGLPAYGEDSALLAALDDAATPSLDRTRYRCGNDAVCGWAGALAGRDGINVIAGTGSMVYGEYAGRCARAGGWGELFSDEGSAYWIAREGLRLFSRMSDGRSPRTALYDLMRAHFDLSADLDLCAQIYGRQQRSHLAALSRVVAQAAVAGDAAAIGLFNHAAAELHEMILAVDRLLQVKDSATLPVSYSGGLFSDPAMLLAPLGQQLQQQAGRYRLQPPRLSPAAGAALYAARLHGTPLDEPALATLQASG
jgi:N-acetylglucosamine kinase-like BadF-type ATPase